MCSADGMCFDSVCCRMGTLSCGSRACSPGTPGQALHRKWPPYLPGGGPLRLPRPLRRTNQLLPQCPETQAAAAAPAPAAAAPWGCSRCCSRGGTRCLPAAGSAALCGAALCLTAGRGRSLATPGLPGSCVDWRWRLEPTACAARCAGTPPAAAASEPAPAAWALAPAPATSELGAMPMLKRSGASLRITTVWPSAIRISRAQLQKSLSCSGGQGPEEGGGLVLDLA
jgi:hypothetical protein